MCLESQHRLQRFCTPSFPDVKLAWTVVSYFEFFSAVLCVSPRPLRWNSL